MIYLFLLYVHWCLTCIYVCVSVLDPQRLKKQRIVSRLVSAGYWTLGINLSWVGGGVVGQRQADLSEFKDSLVYRACSRTARATPVSKSQNQNQTTKQTQTNKKGRS